MNPDVALALAGAPQSARTLWELDEALGKVLATGREPMISRIRLAWWREALERLDREPVPREPVLTALAQHVLPAGVAGAELAEMENGWTAIIGDQPVQREELDIYASGRGGRLFTLTAHLLGGSRDQVEQAGEAWALVDLARHSTEPHDIEAALTAAQACRFPRRWPRRLRPLGMLAILTQRDLERGPLNWEQAGAPPRTARMLRHRLTGW